MIGLRAAIVIADDHPLYREALTTIIERTDDLEVRASVGDLGAALEVMRSARHLLGDDQDDDRAVGRRSSAIATCGLVTARTIRAPASMFPRSVVAR